MFWGAGYAGALIALVLWSGKQLSACSEKCPKGENISGIDVFSRDDVIALFDQECVELVSGLGALLSKLR